MHHPPRTLLLLFACTLTLVGCGEPTSPDEPEAGVASVCAGDTAAGEEETFSCGSNDCTVGMEYCQRETGGAAMKGGNASTSYRCIELPETCSAGSCCECLEESDGGAQATCSKNGPGEFTVDLLRP